MQIQFNVLCEKATNVCIIHSILSVTETPQHLIGLMQSVQSFVVRGKSSQHYFLHMSLHEMCAAKHLITLRQEEQSSLVDNILLGKVPTMSNMLSFYSAFGGLLGGTTSPNMNNYFKFSVKDNRYFYSLDSHRTIEKRIGSNQRIQANPIALMFSYVYESQSPVLCQQLPSNMKI